METRKLTDREVLKTALDHLAECSTWAYELNCEKGKAFCHLVNAAITYGEAVFHEVDPRDLEAVHDLFTYCRTDEQKAAIKREGAL